MVPARRRPHFAFFHPKCILRKMSSSHAGTKSSFYRGPLRFVHLLSQQLQFCCPIGTVWFHNRSCDGAGSLCLEQPTSVLPGPLRQPTGRDFAGHLSKPFVYVLAGPFQELIARFHSHVHRRHLRLLTSLLQRPFRRRFIVFPASNFSIRSRATVTFTSGWRSGTLACG